MAVYWVCDECAVAIENDDYTSYDLDVERVESFVERVGMLADAGMVPQAGYWDCESCEQTQCAGSAHALESVG
jgi:ribosomal protein L37AE/L43A